jgi:hypothetical protein
MADMKVSEGVKFTAGEWCVYKNTDAAAGVECYEVSSKGGESASWIAKVMVRHNPMRPEQGEANAALIAAAPELYAALKELLAWHGPGNAEDMGAKCDTLGEAEDQARAALTKANPGT